MVFMFLYRTFPFQFSNKHKKMILVENLSFLMSYESKFSSSCFDTLCTAYFSKESAGIIWIARSFIYLHLC